MEESSISSSSERQTAVVEQRGRDHEEVVDRRDGMTDDDAVTTPDPTQAQRGGKNERPDDASVEPRGHTPGADNPVPSDPAVGSGMPNPSDMGDQG